MSTHAFALLDNAGGRGYVEIVLQYVLERGEIDDKTAFFKLIDENVSHEVGERIMSLGDRLHAEGKLEGKLEGIHEEKLVIAKKMLREGVELAFVSKVTGLSDTVLRQLQKA